MPRQAIVAETETGRDLSDISAVSQQNAMETVEMGNDRVADDVVLIYATFPSMAEAERIGGALVDRGLVACVNIWPAMTSIYLWQGMRHRDAEVAGIMKTRKALAEQVIAAAKAMHPYENPALVALPVIAGSEPFLAWINAQTARSEQGAAGA